MAYQLTQDNQKLPKQKGALVCCIFEPIVSYKAKRRDSVYDTTVQFVFVHQPEPLVVAVAVAVAVAVVLVVGKTYMTRRKKH